MEDARTVSRITALAIPPAWQDVWICPLENGHLQATGRDAAGRKQYRYHPDWSAVRSLSKFEHIVEFGEALPRIRRRIDRDLRRKGLDRRRVLAAVARLLDTTLIRVGNDEYMKRHQSFGLTTMRGRHVGVNGRTIRFTFVGKSGQPHDITTDDRKLAKIVRKCDELPGRDLFKYVDDEGVVRDVTSGDVNDYLREISGMEITAKDFRTWGGTVLAAMHLAGCGPATSKTQCNRNIVATVKEVAAQLGNRPATCRKYYIHPAMFEAYRDGELERIMQGSSDIESREVPRQSLSSEEAAVLRALRGLRKSA